MSDGLLILNAGSSSLKFCVFGASRALPLAARGHVDLHGRPSFRVVGPDSVTLHEQSWSSEEPLSHADALLAVLSWVRGASAMPRVVAAGHRVVHGGERLAGPEVITEEVMGALRALVPLAPLHQPHNVAAIEAVAGALPGLPQVACFDTAFHRTQSDVVQMYALPRRFLEAGVRRYGFHGLSYEYIASEMARVDAKAAAGRTIVAHLGHGASMCALLEGRSIATTMGFTALDGLVMSTRCGAIDPGVILHLLRSGDMTVSQVEDTLYKQSGLLGVSGVSGDMRELLASDSPSAKLAVELFVYRAAREIGSLVAALGGLDALVFTGGIGENSAAIRGSIARLCAWLGLEIDPQANEAGATRLSRATSRVGAYVIPTNEELLIARHTLECIRLT